MVRKRFLFFFWCGKSFKYKKFVEEYTKNTYSGSTWEYGDGWLEIKVRKQEMMVDWLSKKTRKVRKRVFDSMRDYWWQAYWAEQLIRESTRARACCFYFEVKVRLIRKGESSEIATLSETGTKSSFIGLHNKTGCWVNKNMGNWKKI